MLPHNAPSVAICTGLGDGERGDAEPLEMRPPGRRVGKMLLGVLGEPGNDRSGECMFAHIAQGRLVDHEIGVPGSQQFEEIEPALTLRRAKPSEIVIANLRANAVDAVMPRPGVASGPRTRSISLAGTTRSPLWASRAALRILIGTRRRAGWWPHVPTAPC